MWVGGCVGGWVCTRVCVCVCGWVGVHARVCVIGQRMMSPTIVHFYNRKGGCRRGEKCWYTHEV